jgi:hypothetical protein
LTGSFIWRLLEDKAEAPEEAIVEAVVENFDVNESEAKADVNEFIEDLTKEGLIKVE